MSHFRVRRLRLADGRLPEVRDYKEPKVGVQASRYSIPFRGALAPDPHCRWSGPHSVPPDNSSVPVLSSPPVTLGPTFSGCQLCPLQVGPAVTASLPMHPVAPAGAPSLHRQEVLILCMGCCSQPVTGIHSLNHYIPGKSIILRDRNTIK